MRLILEQRYLFDGSVAHTAHHHDHHHEQGGEHESTTAAAVTNTAVDTPPAVNAQGHAASTKSDSLTSVVFVDSRVADWQELTASLPDTVGVVVVSPDKDGMALVSQVLSEQHDLQSVNFLTYGQSGEVTLGSSTLNAATVMASSAQVTGWGDSLASGGQILFWGCDVGQGADGKALVDDLHTLTGADIAASTDRTGMAQLGGDWTLEQTAGMTSGAVVSPFSATAMAGYDHVLDTVPTADVSFTGSADQVDSALLGGSFTETIQFKNTGGATGYSPYVEIFAPSNAQQNTPLQSLVMVDSSGTKIQTLNTQAITLVDDDPSHSGQVGAYYKGTSASTPAIWVSAPTGLKAGDTMYVASLPFGSYTSGQPTINMVATFGTESSDSSHISQLSSTSGKNVILGVAGGYELGDSATGSTPIQGSDATRQVSVNLLDVSAQIQTSVGEDESPTGPSYTEHYKITINPAPVTANAAVTGTTLTIILPDQVIYTGGNITYTDSKGEQQTLTPDPSSHFVKDAPGGTLVLTLPSSLSSTTGAGTLDIPTYVGRNDAAGNAILTPDASNGQVPPKQTDSLQFSYSANSWNAPSGSLDHATPVTVSGSGTSSGNTSFGAKAFTIEETTEDTTIHTDPISAGTVLPNDVIKHTVKVENSDYYGSSGLVVTGTLSDGQTLDATIMTPVFTYTDSTGEHKIVLGGNADGKSETNQSFTWSTSYDANGKPQTTMVFKLPAAVMLAGSSGNLVYYTTVNPQYANQNPVTEADTLTSDVAATVNLLDASSTPQPVLVNGTTPETAADDTHTSLSVPQGSTTLSVVGINGVPVDGSTTPIIKAGDLVTYKATYHLLTGTFNGLDLASYLPEPLFTTADPNASGGSAYTQVQQQSDNDYISSATVNSNAAGTYMLSNTSPSTVHIDSATASAQLNDLDFKLTDDNHKSDSADKTVSLLFTMRATDAPFANGLLMTSQEQSTFTNGQNNTQATSVILQEQVGSPQAELKTGIVSVMNNNVAATDVSYTVDGSGSAGKPTNYADANSSSIFTTSGDPNTTGLVDQDNLNVTGAQGNESVRVATTVANTGDGAMYGLVVKGSAPIVGGSSLPVSNLTITTSDDPSHLLHLNDQQTKAYFSDSGLDLSTVIGVTGGKVLAAQTKDSSGAVVSSLTITYDVTLPQSTSPDSTLSASATVLSYTNIANGKHNFVTNEVPLGGAKKDIVDSATIGTQAPTTGQSVSGSTINGVPDSSSTDTSGATLRLETGDGPNDNTIVAGEQRNTTITVTVPPGTLSNGDEDVTVTVALPPGATYFASGSDGVKTSGAIQLSSTTVKDNGNGTVTFDLGKNVINTGNSAGTVTLTYGVTYGSMGGDGKTGDLTATLHYTPDQGSATTLSSTATLIEHDPQLTETITAKKTNASTPADPTTATTLPDNEPVYSGEDLTYQVTLNNTSHVPAYDIKINPTSQNLDGVKYFYNNQSFDNLTSLQNQIIKDVYNAGGLASGKSLIYYVTGTVTSTIAAQSNVSVADSGTYTSAPNDLALDGVTAATTPVTGNFSASDPTPAVAKLGADLWIVGESNGTQSGAISLTSPQTSADVVPGDTISLHGVASVPEGQNNDVTLHFTLQPNMTPDLNTIKLLLVSPDGGMQASNLNMSALGLQEAVINAADAKTMADTKEATVSLSDVLHTPGTNFSYNASTGALTINLGKVTDFAKQSAPVYAVVDMQAIVNNSRANTSGTSITPQLQVTSDSHTSNTAQVAETVLEPKVVLTKDVSNIDYAAGTVTYTETLKNTGTATAYGVTLTDPLAAQNEHYVPGSLSIVTSGASTGAPTMTDNAITGTMTLAKGATETFTYSVALNDKTQGAASSTTTATWLSLKGVTQGSATTGGATQSRDGSAALAGVDTYSTSVTTGLAAVSGRVWQNLGNDPSHYTAVLDKGLGVTLTLTPTSGSAPYKQYVATNATDGSYAALVAVYGTPTSIATVSVPVAGQAGLPAQETLIINTAGMLSDTSDTLSSPKTSAVGGLVISDVNMVYAVPDTRPTLAAGGTVGWGQGTPVTGNADGQPVALGSGDVTVKDDEIDRLIAQSQTGQQGDSYNGTVLTVQRYVSNQAKASAEDSFAGSGVGATGVVFSGNAVQVDGLTVGTLAQAGGKLQITFNANATAALIGQTIAGLTYTYTGNSNDPGLSKVIIGATLSDNNPTTSGPQGVGTAESLPLYSAVDIPPPSFAASYQEQNNPSSLPGTAVPIDPGLSLQDASGGASPNSIQQVVIQIVNRQAGEDVLAVSIPTGEGLVQSVGKDGTLTITSDGTTQMAQWQSVLRGVSYYNTSAEPTTGTRTIQIALYENNSTTPVQTNGTITVLAADNSPVLDTSRPVSLSTTEYDSTTHGNPGMGVGTAIADLVGLKGANSGPGNVTDPDGANLTEATAGQGSQPGIAITDALTTAGLPDGTANASIGTWLYTTDGGKTWTPFAGNGVTAPLGAGDALHLIADPAGQNRVYFQSSQPNWNGTISNALTFRAWDQSDGAANGRISTLPRTDSLGTGINTAGAAYSNTADTLDLHVNATNNAPIATGSIPPLAGKEDTTAPAQSVGALFGPTFSDVADQQHSASNTTGSFANTLAGVAITSDLATPDQGHWQYSTDGGKSWVNIPTNVSTTNALVLSASTQIVFVPTANFNGQPGGLSATLIDSSTDVPLYHNNQGTPVTGADLAGGNMAQTGVDVSRTGGSTALSVASVPLTTTITAVNDAPVASGSAVLVMPGEVDPKHPYSQTVGSLFDSTFSDRADQQRSLANPTGSVANTLVGVAIVSDGADPKTQGSWIYSKDGGKTWQTLDPTTVSPTAALVLPRNTLLSFLPVSGYTGVPGQLGAALIESGSPLAQGMVTARVDISGMMQNPIGTLSHTLVMLHTVIPDARPHGLPSLPSVMQSGNPSALALATDAIEAVFKSSFERSLSASHQTWVRGSSVYRFVSTETEAGTEVPMGAFVTPNGTESQLELQASMADGSPLPNWLSFNSVGRVFNGTPPNDILGGTMDLKVVGHDMFGHQAQVDVHVVLGHKAELAQMIDVNETPRTIHESMDSLQHGASALLFAPLPDVAVPNAPPPVGGKSALRSQLRNVGSIAHSRAARGLLDRRAF